MKRVAGLRCEICAQEFPAPVLELHRIPSAHRQQTPLADAGDILVLCPGCHYEIHHLKIPRKTQKACTSVRSRELAAGLQAILDRPDTHYSPPEAPDAGQLFEDALRQGGMDLFLNGA